MNLAFGCHWSHWAFWNLNWKYKMGELGRDNWRSIGQKTTIVDFSKLQFLMTSSWFYFSFWMVKSGSRDFVARGSSFCKALLHQRQDCTSMSEISHSFTHYWSPFFRPTEDTNYVRAYSIQHQLIKQKKKSKMNKAQGECAHMNSYHKLPILCHVEMKSVLLFLLHTCSMIIIIIWLWFGR